MKPTIKWFRTATSRWHADSDFIRPAKSTRYLVLLCGTDVPGDFVAVHERPGPPPNNVCKHCLHKVT